MLPDIALEAARLSSPVNDSARLQSCTQPNVGARVLSSTSRGLPWPMPNLSGKLLPNIGTLTGITFNPTSAANAQAARTIVVRTSARLLLRTIHFSPKATTGTLCPSLTPHEMTIGDPRILLLDLMELESL